MGEGLNGLCKWLLLYHQEFISHNELAAIHGWITKIWSSYLQMSQWLHFTLGIYSLADNQTVFLHRNQGNAMYGTFIGALAQTDYWNI